MCVVTNRQEVKPRESKGLSDGQGAKYFRFGAMILTAMVIMYGVTYLNSFQLDHVRWSEQRGFMTLLMGSTMTVVMLLFMLARTRTRRSTSESWPEPSCCSGWDCSSYGTRPRFKTARTWVR